MTLLTAEKDGRYITELYIDGGPNVAYRTTQADPEEGWADLLEVDGNGEFVGNGREPVITRVYGKITYVDKRELGK